MWGFPGTKMDNLDYLEFDHSANRHFGEGYGGSIFARPPLPRCKWCGVRIDWFARGKQWIAYHRGVPHRCEKRIEADLKAAIASMPDADEP